MNHKIGLNITLIAENNMKQFITLNPKAKMNDRYYIDKLTYEVGEVVLYNGKKHKIVHIHEDGLMNLENGKNYIYGCNPMMFYKINVSETIT